MNPTAISKIRSVCKCGICAIELSQVPKARLICHCKTCQIFTGQCISDVVIVPQNRGEFFGREYIVFNKYKKFRFPPPNLNRGKCVKCSRPVVETVGIQPLTILFIPSRNFEDYDILPAPSGHIFYESRRRDMNDGLPKYEGYLSSQMAIAKWLLKAM